MIRTTCRPALTGLALLVVAGCAAGPGYSKPDPPEASGWQAPLPHSGSPSRMADWWGQFNDPVLSELQQAAQQDSPTLDKAAAAIRAARAGVTSAHAAYWPSIDASASATRSGERSGSASNATAGGLDASWELDLFGGNRRSSEAAVANLVARQAQWHDARVSLAAEVATDYVDFRACRLKEAAYRVQAVSYQETLRSTRVSANAGFTAPADLALAEASAATASSSATAQGAQCDLGIKALVAVTGLPEARVRALLGEDTPPLPTSGETTVESIPASLVTQRPDIVSAERELAAASASIGVAEAARWPRLVINGTITASQAAGVATTPWSLASTVTAPLLRGGALAADVEKARADFDSKLAEYESAVRTAVLEVEQALVKLDSAARREKDAQTSASQYRVYFRANEINWRAGRLSLLDLELARRSALTAEISLIELTQARVDQWIALYKALGGSWKPLDAAGTHGDSK